MPVMHREVIVSSRNERVSDLDVRIDTVRYETFLGRPGCETVLTSNESYDAHVTRDGKYVTIYWSYETGTDPVKTWTCMSNAPLAHIRSADEFLEELRVLPPEAIR
jgi:hypothetical protein